MFCSNILMINLIAISYTIKHCCTFNIHRSPYTFTSMYAHFFDQFSRTTVNKQYSHSFSLPFYFEAFVMKEISSFRNWKCSKFTITFNDYIKKFVRPEKSTISGFLGVHIQKSFSIFTTLFHTCSFTIPHMVDRKNGFQSFDFNNRQWPQF